MRVFWLFLVISMAAAGWAQADTIPISSDSFSAGAALITFSNATDNKSGDPIAVGGVTFDNLSSDSLYSGYYPNNAYGNRAIYFGKASDDGQLIDLVGQTNYTITFAPGSVVNRVGMELATGGTEGHAVTWFYEAYGANDSLLGGGSVTGTIVNLQNGTFIPNPFYATGSVFLGFQSSSDIDRVRLYQTENDANITIMDNLRFEAVEAAAVPAPNSIVGLLSMGVIGLVIAWRRKRA